ncbi:hypothetical protein N183_32245 [Sinorhizobium sp. Sb3]|nr:hypothetical protein N183_32245 [Sinorhizobium sp. Sb3]
MWLQKLHGEPPPSKSFASANRGAEKELFQQSWGTADS